MVRRFLARGSRRRRPQLGSALPSAEGLDMLPLDDEVEAMPRRRLVPEASHAMFPPEDTGDEEGNDDGDNDGDDSDLLDRQTTFSKEEIDRLLEERERTKFQDDEQKKDYAKAKILRMSRSPQHLMRLADNLIDESWLGAVDEMPGNIYRIAAFGGLSIDSLQNLSRYLGAISIWLVQFFGPPAVFMTSFGMGVVEEQAYKWDEWTNWSDPNEKMSYLLTDWGVCPFPKFLAMVFIFLFTLNGLFVLIDEKKCFRQMDEMFRYLDRETLKFTWSGECHLYLDALMNNWVVIWCTLDAFILVGNCRSVKDVLFDSLSLLFLYNLDDITGDLGFVNDDDWDGLRLGWIYHEMTVPRFSSRGTMNDDFYGDDDEIAPSYGYLCLYKATIRALAVATVVLPIMSIFTPFTLIGPED